MDIQWYTGINQQYLYVHESTLVFANWTRGIYHNLWRLDSGKMTKKTSRWGLEGTSNSTRFSIVREVCFLWCDMTNCAVLGLDVQVRKSIVHIYIYTTAAGFKKTLCPDALPLAVGRGRRIYIYIYIIYILTSIFVRFLTRTCHRCSCEELHKVVSISNGSVMVVHPYFLSSNLAWYDDLNYPLVI